MKVSLIVIIAIIIVFVLVVFPLIISKKAEKKNHF
jgi:flagellar biogenesis protein FliO